MQENPEDHPSKQPHLIKPLHYGQRVHPVPQPFLPSEQEESQAKNTMDCLETVLRACSLVGLETWNDPETIDIAHLDAAIKVIIQEKNNRHLFEQTSFLQQRMDTLTQQYDMCVKEINIRADGNNGNNTDALPDPVLKRLYQLKLTFYYAIHIDEVYGHLKAEHDRRNGVIDLKQILVPIDPSSTMSDEELNDLFPPKS